MGLDVYNMLMIGPPGYRGKNCNVDPYAPSGSEGTALEAGSWPGLTSYWSQGGTALPYGTTHTLWSGSLRAGAGANPYDGDVLSA